MSLYHQKIKTEIGILHLVADDTHLRILAFPSNWEKLKKKLKEPIEDASSPVIAKTIKQLEEYWSGNRTTFSIPFLLEGTSFQAEVWNSLLQIPYGETSSYEEQAKKLGKPKAIRAMASANGANPISIILPCHRVIGKNGSLTGYAGGLPIKKFLLECEKPKTQKKNS